MVNLLHYENTVLKQRYEMFVSLVIQEILGMKIRIEVLEKKETNKNVTIDFIVADLINQKQTLQKKLDQVDQSINFLDKKIKEFDTTETVKDIDDSKDESQRETKQCTYDRRGFCKSKRNCPFVVFGECKKSRCIKRHPKTCYAFFESRC